jgi:hypothetical protein
MLSCHITAAIEKKKEISFSSSKEEGKESSFPSSFEEKEIPRM